MLGCEHITTLIQSCHGSSGEETVTVCRRCGVIEVRAYQSGVRFSTSFHLASSYLLIAASQAYRLCNERDAEDVLGKTTSKPLDFAHLRLYQVRLHWCMKDGTKGTEYYVVAADSPNQSDRSAANQIRELYKESYDNNPELSYWDVRGYALNVLQPLSWTANGISVLEQEFAEVFVSGEYICPQCGFRLSKRIIDAGSGEVGLAREEEIPSCPNDGKQMTVVTWRQAAADASAMAQRDRAWVNRLEAAWPEGYPMPVEFDVFATDEDPISACCAGNTGGSQHVGCVYPGCRCECHREDQDGGTPAS